MRGVSKRIQRGGALLALMVALTAFAAYADEPSPLDPPQVRVSPPIGAAASAAEPSLLDPLQNRIRPPGGTASSLDPPQAKISPPGGAPNAERSFFDLFWMWLQVQAKIRPPIG